MSAIDENGANLRAELFQMDFTYCLTVHVSQDTHSGAADMGTSAPDSVRDDAHCENVGHEWSHEQI